jgi:hypothetical protein
MYSILAAILNPPAPPLVISQWSALQYASYHGLSWGFAYLYTQVPTPPYWLTHFFHLATAGLSVVHNSFWHSSWTTDTERQHIHLKHKQCSIPSLMTRILSYTAARNLKTHKIVLICGCIALVWRKQYASDVVNFLLLQGIMMYV